MKCKEHRRYNGKTKPENNCHDCWKKFLNKSATYEDVCEELKRRKDRDPDLNLESGLYEFEQIDSVSHMLRCYKWTEDDKRKNNMKYKDYTNRVPEYPFRYRSVTNDTYAYFIDANGIIWIKFDKDGAYESPCLAICVTHIIATDGWDTYLDIKRFIQEHLIPYKESSYEYYKKYDKSFVSEEK